jgi:hypothetical protein
VLVGVEDDVEHAIASGGDGPGGRSDLLGLLPGDLQVVTV